MNNRATITDSPIPALSPFILTSNPPPPFHDSGFMRRIIERNFPQSEDWKENDPQRDCVQGIPTHELETVEGTR